MEPSVLNTHAPPARTYVLQLTDGGRMEVKAQRVKITEESYSFELEGSVPLVIDDAQIVSGRDSLRRPKTTVNEVLKAPDPQ